MRGRSWTAVALTLLLLFGAPLARAETKLKVGKSGGPLLLTLVELGQEAKIWPGSWTRRWRERRQGHRGRNL